MATEIANDFMSENYDVIAIFLIYIQFGQIRKQFSECMLNS